MIKAIIFITCFNTLILYCKSNDSLRYANAYQSITNDSNITVFLVKNFPNMLNSNICISKNTFNLDILFFLDEIFSAEYRYVDSLHKRNIKDSLVIAQYKNFHDSNYIKPTGIIPLNATHFKKCNLKIFFSTIYNDRLRATILLVSDSKDDFYALEPNSPFSIEFLIYFKDTSIDQKYYKLTAQ